MPCYHIKLPDGGKVILCGRLGKHCADCADVGAYLCDYPVGPRGKTCDRSMCGEHAHEIGPNLHYCETHFRLWQKTATRQGVLPLDRD
jgi:hypothetical protein